MRTSSPDKQQAFTLLEIMVALALFALVGAAIYSSWFAVMRGSQVGLNSAAKVQRSRMAMQILEEALTSVRSFDADNQYYTFIGENGAQATLSFVSRLADSFPRSGRFGDLCVRRVEFSLQPGPDSGKQLVLRQNPISMRLEDFKDEVEHPVVIARDVKKFALEFWDGKSEDWLDVWEKTNQIPKMIRIKLQFVGDDFGPAARENIKVIAPPSVAVPARLQGGGGGPGGPGGGPGQPGGLNVPNIPGNNLSLPRGKAPR